ncbi:hypothetical protein HK102_013070 [Quaeritorhiza haematococci]|nr:hypothetical protein HK102_013070 [Quaeritorhiza haematococci]
MKREQEKLAAAGQKPTTTNSGPSSPKAPTVANKNYTEARLQIRLPAGPPLVQTFKSDDTLQSVYTFITTSNPSAFPTDRAFKLAQTFPRKVLVKGNTNFSFHVEGGVSDSTYGRIRSFVAYISTNS